MTSTIVAGDWYVNSASHWLGGTHYGPLKDRTVHAACGVSFTPEPDLHKVVSRAMVPMQPGRPCSRCCDAAGISVDTVEEPRHRWRSAVPEWRSGADKVAAPLFVALRAAADNTPAAASAPVAVPVDTAPVATAGEEGDTGPEESADSARTRLQGWHEGSPRPGDTHWVATSVRGNKISLCGRSVRAKTRIETPAPVSLCPKCKDLRGSPRAQRDD